VGINGFTLGERHQSCPTNIYRPPEIPLPLQSGWAILTIEAAPAAQQGCEASRGGGDPESCSLPSPGKVRTAGQVAPR
jgi:hypothetical protein